MATDTLDFKRTEKKLEIEKRREIVASLYTRGVPYAEIARQVGVKSKQTVWADIQAILDDWRKYHLTDINKFLLVELRRTMEIENEAWHEWERSKLDRESVRVTEAIMTDLDLDDPTLISIVGGLIPTERQTTKAGRLGDPAYLLIIDKMIDKRAKLLGLYAPERLQLENPEDARDFGAQAKATLLGRLLSSPAIGDTNGETKQPDG